MAARALASCMPSSLRSRGNGSPGSALAEAGWAWGARAKNFRRAGDACTTRAVRRGMPPEEEGRHRAATTPGAVVRHSGDRKGRSE